MKWNEEGDQYSREGQVCNIKKGLSERSSEKVIWTNTWRIWRSKESGERKKSSYAHIFELCKVISSTSKKSKFTKWLDFHFYYLSISQSVKQYCFLEKSEMKISQIWFFKEDILHHKGIWRSKLIESMFKQSSQRQKLWPKITFKPFKSSIKSARQLS